MNCKALSGELGVPPNLGYHQWTVTVLCMRPRLCHCAGSTCGCQPGDAGRPLFAYRLLGGRGVGGGGGGSGFCAASIHVTLLHLS